VQFTNELRTKSHAEMANVISVETLTAAGGLKFINETHTSNDLRAESLQY